MLFFFKACLMFQFRKKSDRSWLLENFVSKCEKTKQIGCHKKNLFWNCRIKGFLVIYVFRFQLSIEHVFNNDAIYIVLLEQERRFKRSVALLEFLVLLSFFAYRLSMWRAGLWWICFRVSFANSVASWASIRLI